MICGQSTLVGTANGQGVAASLQCRCWSCPDCEQRNRYKLRKLIEQLGPNLFITLTVNPRCFDGRNKRAQRLSAAFSKFRQNLRRQIGQDCDFVAVFESTIRGEPHLHVALRVNGLAPKQLRSDLSRWMGKLTGAANVKVSAVWDVARLAGYMSKSPALFDGCRRYWTSRGWRLMEWARDAAFHLLTIVYAPLAKVERAAVAAGHIVTDRSRRRFKTQLPFAPP